jgi:hypothetical protein
MKLTYHFEGGNLDPYEFEVSDSDLRRAIKVVDPASFAVLDDDNLEVVAEGLEDLLADYFEEDAREEYKDAKLLATNPDRYYGVSRRD